MYLLRVPTWLRKWLPKGIWEQSPGIQLSVYLTFDDGPHPKATPFVLDQLADYSAKGTFFCLGKNVKEYPDIFQRTLAEGHQVGNHTYHHLNGWKNSPKKYLSDVEKARQEINSDLFRPPYGRIKRRQAKAVKKLGFQLVYWSLLSGDFDVNLRPQKCLKNITEHIQPGDIVVFHDSEKAWERLQFVLPRVLEFCRKQGWQLKSL